MSRCGGCPTGAAEIIEQEDEKKAIELNPNTPVITLTEKAVEKAKEFMIAEKKPNFGLRIVVVPGGCAGYEYGMDFDEKAKENDITLEQHGMKIFIDKESAAHMAGTEIDFVETLHEVGFKINNPNAKKTCDCGNSFS